MQTIGLVHSSGAAGMHDGAFGVAATIMADNPPQIWGIMYLTSMVT
jgi:hypothetical protein